MNMERLEDAKSELVEDDLRGLATDSQRISYQRPARPRSHCPKPSSTRGMEIPGRASRYSEDTGMDYWLSNPAQQLEVAVRRSEVQSQLKSWYVIRSRKSDGTIVFSMAYVVVVEFRWKQPVPIFL